MAESRGNEASGTAIAMSEYIEFVQSPRLTLAYRKTYGGMFSRETVAVLVVPSGVHWVEFAETARPILTMLFNSTVADASASE